MKFLLLVCWDAEKMNELEEPDGSEAEDQDGFPWLDELQARGAWVIGDQRERKSLIPLMTLLTSLVE